jgi:hypothetical protein
MRSQRLNLRRHQGEKKTTNALSNYYRNFRTNEYGVDSAPLRARWAERSVDANDIHFGLIESLRRSIWSHPVANNFGGINQLCHTQTQSRRLVWTSRACRATVAYLHATCATVGSVPQNFLHSIYFNVNSKQPHIV